jgi:hypothetical protein
MATFTAEALHLYMIHITGIEGATPGYFVAEIYMNEPSEHSTCTTARRITRMPYSGTGLTSLAGPSWSNCAGATKQGIWYNVTGTGKKMAASTCTDETDYDTIMDLYTSCDQTAQCVATNDDAQNCGTSSKILWNSVLGQHYLLLVTGYRGAHGVYEIEVFDEEAPDNSFCSQAIPIPAAKFPYMTEGITTYAKPSNGSCHHGVIPGVWYSMPGTGRWMTLSTCFEATTYQTMIDVYKGCTGDSGVSCITVDDANDYVACPPKSEIKFAAETGTNYWIFVSGRVEAESPTGFFRMAILEGDPINPVLPSESSSRKGGLSGGAKFGIALLVILIVVGIPAGVIGGVWYYRKRKADYAPIK